MSRLFSIATYALIISSSAFGQTVTNGNFNLANYGWSCNPEVNYETVYGGSNFNLVAEVDEANALCQTISGFTVGSRYRLRLKVSRRTTCGPAQQRMRITVSNSALNVTVSRNGTAYNLTEESFEFTATSTSHVLNFVTLTEGTCNLLVDDIRIQLVSGLPVELTAFDAKAEEDVAKLSWTTASEFRNDYFTVERSQDGKNWENIATVKGVGTTEEEWNYAFDDPNPYRGISYYRLWQTDFDGTTEMLGVRSVNFDEADELQIFPNPAKEQVTVTVDDFTVIRLFDSMGKEITDRVAMESSNSGIVLTLTDLAPGMYWVQTLEGSREFIKE